MERSKLESRADMFKAGSERVKIDEGELGEKMSAEIQIV